MPEVLKFFPFPSFKENQEKTIIKIQEHFDNGKECVILESPTGSGKSGIAVCLSLYNGDSFILTPQKILQDQYYRDFSTGGLSLIKGKSNYNCIYFRDINCSEGCQQMVKKCPMKDMCTYEIAKKQALASKMILTNYSYFLHVIEFARFFKERELMVLDECHQIEKETFKIVEFNFSSYYLSKLGVVSKIPQYKTLQEYVHWINELDSTIQRLKGQVEEKVSTLEEEDTVDLVMIANLRKEYEMLETQAKKIEKFMGTYEKTEWIFDITDSKVGNKITFKPLTIASFAQELLFSSSKKKLLMSATVGGKRNICKTLGLDQNNCEYIYVPSHFDNDKRQIFLTNSGVMSKNKIDTSLPKVVEDLNKILEHHENERGLIHTHTFKIAEYIKLNIADKYKNRIMTHTSETRSSTLEDFMSSTEPKVMVTPSMTDGIDLKDDLARFIVIVKIPYLYLGDKQIKRRMEIDEEWYRWSAALTIVQAAGRAMRHEDDYCTIYIMDSGIKYFIRQNREFFPQYFVDSIQN